MREDPELGLPPRWTRLRYVRCEACGAKALVAASQCPQCEEPLGLRDSFGQPVPLAHCQNCDLYYPRNRGKCIWCGTTPKAFPMRRAIWGAAATLAFAGLVWGAWWAKNSELAPPALAVAPEPDTGAVVVVPAYLDRNAAASAGEAALPRDSARTDPIASDSATGADVAVTPDSLTSSASLANVTPADSAPDSSPAPTPTAVVPPGVAVAPAPPPETAPPRAPTATKSTARAPPKVATPPAPRRPTANRATAKAPASRPPANRATANRPPASRAATNRAVTTRPPAARTRWVAATVRGWLRVRSSASKGSRTVAMIGPDTRLQVGESKGGWTRVRSAGATGWVEQQQLQKNSTFRQPRSPARVGTAR